MLTPQEEDFLYTTFDRYCQRTGVFFKESHTSDPDKLAFQLTHSIREHEAELMLDAMRKKGIRLFWATATSLTLELTRG